ncbi:hypothetical protein [Paracraurococcus lichenis]|uniref:Uncharacterized protein n=1 Tax=Paracraurococcus lichenis TaxID=3064888 RepID=A0ABT9DZC3_9PROT|nr:hypothetical protein [Paracraurococcus sp. LOR1-02]MDO9709258.1 hypothetical protein [Paracraurococcus sp. LOR1-02]
MLKDDSRDHAHWRRTVLGGILGCTVITAAEARERPRPDPREYERDVAQLSALVETQQAEIAKLRRALGLHPDGQMQAPRPRRQ